MTVVKEMSHFTLILQTSDVVRRDADIAVDQLIGRRAWVGFDVAAHPLNCPNNHSTMTLLDLKDWGCGYWFHTKFINKFISLLFQAQSRSRV